MPKDADHAPVFALDPAPEPALALWLVEQAEARGTLLYIARGEGRLDRVAGAARVFAGGRVEVLVLPPWDVLPYDRAAPSAGVVGRRVEALAALARPAERPRLVLTSAEAALQRVRPPRAWRGAELVLARGETWRLDALRAALAERGYHHLDERVDEPGEVAVRGRVIDVFPAGRSQPVRLLVRRIGDGPGADGTADGAGENAGETVGIVALHGYDPATQRSTEDLDRVVLYPAVEFPLAPEEVEEAAEALAHPEDADASAETADPGLPVPPRLVPVFDYLPDAAAVLDDEVKERWHAFREQVEDGFAAGSEMRRTAPSGGVLPRPRRLYLTPDQARDAVFARRLPPDAPGTPVEPPRRVDALLRLARAALDRGDRVAVVAPEAPGRVAASLARRGLPVRAVSDWDAVYQHLLAQVLAGLRGEPPAPPPPEVRVGLTGRIPADYVPEPDLRLSLYRRLARMEAPSESAEFEDELADRFGPVPPDVSPLLALVRLRLLCARAGIARLDAGPRAAALTPRDPARARRLARARRARAGQAVASGHVRVAGAGARGTLGGPAGRLGLGPVSPGAGEAGRDPPDVRAPARSHRSKGF